MQETVPDNELSDGSPGLDNLLIEPNDSKLRVESSNLARVFHAAAPLATVPRSDNGFQNAFTALIYKRVSGRVLSVWHEIADVDCQ